MSGNSPHRGNGQFGIYVHWPFCASKCPYCDFNSHVRRGPFDEEAFVAAYEQELAYFAELKPEEEVASIFFGGGTPSLMQPESVGTLLDTIARLWPVAANAEITIEANPNSVEASRFRGYKAAGVNRVSIGVQSLRPEPLAALGRLHTVEEARNAIRLAQKVFDRSSFDLIYARPHQSLVDWQDELGEALERSAGHLSLYQLTIEQGTRYFDLFRAGKLKMPDADLSADFYEMTRAICADAGMPGYEISNYARPGAESRHNLLYWHYGEYVGTGPGAHGRLILDSVRHATATEKMPSAWRTRVLNRGHGMVTDDLLTWEEEGDEFLVMGLRLAEGIDPERYTRLSGRVLNPRQIEDLRFAEMIETLPNGNLRVTERGFTVLDAVVADLAA